MKLPYCVISGYSKTKCYCEYMCSSLKGTLNKLCKRKNKYIDMDEGSRYFNKEDEYDSPDISIIFPTTSQVYSRNR